SLQFNSNIVTFSFQFGLRVTAVITVILQILRDSYKISDSVIMSERSTTKVIKIIGQ
ncbi:hypothetical protein L9F63_023992, partial [Diploptera punctata]